MDITELLASKKPQQRTVTLFIDPSVEPAVIDAQAAVDRAQERVDRMPSNASALADLTEARDRLAAAQADAKAASVTFVFVSIGREAREDLLAEYPPTKQQRDEYKKQALARGIPDYAAGDLAYNVDTYPPAIIAASCVQIAKGDETILPVLEPAPAMTLEAAQELWTSKRFSDGELGELLAGAQAAQTQSRRVDLGNA